MRCPRKDGCKSREDLKQFSCSEEKNPREMEGRVQGKFGSGTRSSGTTGCDHCAIKTGYFAHRMTHNWLTN